jgi:hypothetical protein
MTPDAMSIRLHLRRLRGLECRPRCRSGCKCRWPTPPGWKPGDRPFMRGPAHHPLVRQPASPVGFATNGHRRRRIPSPPGTGSPG